MSSTPSVPQLKKMVELMLEANPMYKGVEARNSDIALTILIWMRWYNVDETVAVARLFNLPREDNVKRVRAVLQNVEHKYLPTDPSILIKRGIEEAYWFDALGYNLTKEEWQTHYKTKAELKKTEEKVVYETNMPEGRPSNMIKEGDTVGLKGFGHAASEVVARAVRVEPAVGGGIDLKLERVDPPRTTKMKAIYLPKTYSNSGLQQNEEYEIEVEQLATGKPIKMVTPIEAVYPSLQSFGKTWKVVG